MGSYRHSSSRTHARNTHTNTHTQTTLVLRSLEILTAQLPHRAKECALAVVGETVNGFLGQSGPVLLEPLEPSVILSKGVAIGAECLQDALGTLPAGGRWRSSNQSAVRSVVVMVMG